MLQYSTAQEQLGKFLRSTYGNLNLFKSGKYRIFIWRVSELADTLTREGNTDHFDNYEVHPCRVVSEEPDGTQNVEQCEPHEAQFWTVYGHYHGQGSRGGLEAIHDFETWDEANFAKENLTRTTL